MTLSKESGWLMVGALIGLGLLAVLGVPGEGAPWLRVLSGVLFTGTGLLNLWVAFLPPPRPSNNFNLAVAGYLFMFAASHFVLVVLA